MATVAADIPTTDMASAMLDYLRQRLHVAGLAYAQEPVYIPNGWEAHVYHFQLQSRHPLPETFTQPLVVRAYCCPHMGARLRHEADIQNYVGNHGYPVARPLLVEERANVCGGPFMIMERAPGENLFEIMLHHWYTILWGPARMAETHVRLHQLPPNSSAKIVEPFWQCSMGALEANIHKHDLNRLAPGLDWLDAHAPALPTTDCILHLDFHPINLMFDGHHCNAVLDWGEWDLGDRHADVATTVVLIKLAPVELPRLRHKIAGAIGKHLLEHGYLHTYRKYLPIDDEKLRC